MYQVDLLLGSSLGRWVLTRVDPAQVGQVFTLDDEIVVFCRELGLTVSTSDINAVNYQPAPIALSVHYPIIIRPDPIGQYTAIYNIHPGYLPWGRGFYPVFWALFENTPAGATLHKITPGVDEGPIVDQIGVEQYDWDTGGSLHERVTNAEKVLFERYWHRLLSEGDLNANPQQGVGSSHLKREFFYLKKGKGWRQLTAEQLMRLIRALTYPGYTGLEIQLGQKRFSVELQAVDDNLF